MGKVSPVGLPLFYAFRLANEHPSHRRRRYPYSPYPNPGPSSKAERPPPPRSSIWMRASILYPTLANNPILSHLIKTHQVRQELYQTLSTSPTSRKSPINLSIGFQDPSQSTRQGTHAAPRQPVAASYQGHSLHTSRDSFPTMAPGKPSFARLTHRRQIASASHHTHIVLQPSSNQHRGLLKASYQIHPGNWFV